MEIKLIKMKLKNFKGIKDLEINFEGRNANIYGRNATGKTTIFDAFKWTFFDKDSNDRKDFNIKTLDKNNNPIHFLEHEVEITLEIDSLRTTFRKMLQEKWVRKRGQEQQEFSGHETSYWIDEVPAKKKEYDERINNLIPESLFKLITDPEFFNTKMEWKERRELLLNIANVNISDNEILSLKDEFKCIKDNLKERSIEDYQKVVIAKIKELNKEKEQIPIRIDELTSTIITEHHIDYSKLEEEKKIHIQQLDELENQLTNTQLRAQENMKKVENLTRKKNELNNLKFKLKVEHSNKYSSEVIRLENEKSVIEGRIRNASTELKQLLVENENQENTIKKLREEWYQVENEQLEIDEKNFICPTCGREYLEEKIYEIREKAKQDFIKTQEEKKNEINKEGQSRKEIVEKNKLRIDELQQQLKKYNDELIVINSSLKENEEKSKNNEAFDINNVPEYKEKLLEIESLQKEVDSLVNGDTTKIQNQKNNIKNKINEIDQKLNEKLAQDKIKTRISELEKQEEEISNRIQELEKQQYELEEFTKTKVELLENAINDKFKIVKFRLFTTQINGGLQECCDTLVNGVPYQDVNNAHKILAGLDIINTLMKFYNVEAPIFIDNRESINELYNIDTQIISLVVTNDPVLRIEVI